MNIFRTNHFIRPLYTLKTLPIKFKEKAKLEFNNINDLANSKIFIFKNKIYICDECTVINMYKNEDKNVENYAKDTFNYYLEDEKLSITLFIKCVTANTIQIHTYCE